MNKQLATAFSYVFHPLMMSTYLFSIIVWLSPYNVLPVGFSTTGSAVLIALVWITTFLIPALSLFVLKMSGNITSLTLKNREERITPIIYTTVMYGVTTYLFGVKVELGPLISVLLGISTLLIGLTGLITLFWKISIHTLALGGLIGMLMAINQNTSIPNITVMLSALFVLSGVVASARLKLNAHSPVQVYSGFVLGVFVSFASYTLYIS
ncbi:MAG: hypothetical protein KDC58_02545 [Cyclobacteriaceae bacterium]|nr:hypothetical protein [Cyclobacteriaceae bacterium]